MTPDPFPISAMLETARQRRFGDVIVRMYKISQSQQWVVSVTWWALGSNDHMYDLCMKATGHPRCRDEFSSITAALEYYHKMCIFWMIHGGAEVNV